MTAEGWVLIIGAAGSQIVLALQAWKASRSVGSPNGLGSVHEALATINGKLDAIGDRVTTLEHKVL